MNKVELSGKIIDKPKYCKNEKGNDLLKLMIEIENGNLQTTRVKVWVFNKQLTELSFLPQRDDQVTVIGILMNPKNGNRKLEALEVWAMN